MSRIEELREPVRSIAMDFKARGFTITDVMSVGLLVVKNWDSNRMSRYIKLLGQANMDADSIVAAAEADTKDRKRKPDRPGLKAG